MSTVSSYSLTDLNVEDGVQRPCRFCNTQLTHTAIDLGASPLCENVRRPEEMDQPETYFPLRVFVCDECWLVQLREYVAPDKIFTEYAYFSSNSDSWLQHAEKYCEHVTKRFGLGPEQQVVEIASNDGYLLQNFVQSGIPALGVEPAANVAEVARAKGVKTVVKFFGVETARELVADGYSADLLLGNNVLAHVPNLNDFVGGLKLLLKPDGVITMEFPHLLQLVEQNQFDTIYHEHYSYLKVLTVSKIFGQHGLRIFDVQELKSHGGSLRVFATHQDNKTHQIFASVDRIKTQEREAGLDSLTAYHAFRERVSALKMKILEFLIQAKKTGKRVAGYGAPGKGITLLNYCGIRADLIGYTVDRNKYKQGTFVPGTGIPVLSPETLEKDQPDYVFILPWNLKQEIMSQVDAAKWGGKFVVPIPHLEII